MTGNGGRGREPKTERDREARAPDRTDQPAVGRRPAQSLVETTSVPIFVHTPDRGIVRGNRRAAELLGVEDQTALLGRKPERFVHPGRREEARQRLRHVAEEGESTEPAEFPLCGCDGEERVAEITAVPVTYDGEPSAFVVLEEVTSGRRSRTRLRRERQFLETVIDAVDDVLYVIDGDGRAYHWNETLVETTGYSHEEIDAMHPMELIPEDHHEHVPGLMEAIDAIEDRRVVVDILTADGDRIPHEFRGTTIEDPETGEVFRCGIARDVTKRLERERRLERQRDELATLDRINELLLETARELIQTSSREAVERTVCERLVASDFYQFSWVGERELDGDRIVPRTRAGEDRGYLDAVTVTADDSATDRGPAGRAMRTGEIQALTVDDPSFEPWNRPAKERGFESVAAVPLRHGETVFGVLVVYATRENAFSEREQAGFDVLGRTVGFVIHTARSQDLLFADAVVELELDVGEGARVVRIAADVDCEISLDGYVAAGERWIQYLTVTGARPGEVAEALAADPVVDRGRIVSEGCDGGRIELVAAESSLLQTVTAAGATVRAVDADPDGARVVVEAPVGVDTRGIVDRIQSEYPTSKLVAHREHDREVATVGRPGGLLDELTGRQREILEAAYRAGYFTWPRESTAEEVAESLDLASATLHGHVRKAEQCIFSMLFDGE